MLYLFFRKEQQPAKPRTGKFIDNRTSEVFRQKIVYKRTQKSTDRARQEDTENIKVTLGSLVCCKRNHGFRRKGDERTLDGHKQSHREIIQIGHVPIEQGMKKLHIRSFLII